MFFCLFWPWSFQCYQLTHIWAYLRAHRTRPFLLLVQAPSGLHAVPCYLSPIHGHLPGHRYTLLQFTDVICSVQYPACIPWDFSASLCLWATCPVLVTSVRWTHFRVLRDCRTLSPPPGPIKWGSRPNPFGSLCLHLFRDMSEKNFWFVFLSQL